MRATTTLILDGIWGRPDRFRPLQRLIAERCGPAEIHRYDCSGTCPLDELGDRLARAVRDLDGPVDLIGFSMGGLVIRAARMLRPGLPLRRAVFLNTPHAGSWFAYALGIAAVRQMRPRSDFLARLDAAPWDVPSLCIYCLGDLMVLPNSSANWPRATQTVRSRVPAHVWPIYSRALRRRVVEFLAGPAPSRADDTARPHRVGCDPQMT